MALPLISCLGSIVKVLRELSLRDVPTEALWADSCSGNFMFYLTIKQISAQARVDRLICSF